MSEYKIGFAKKMSEASLSIVDNGLDSEDAKRATLYIALVSCEIALKSALEKAGMPVKKIKAKSHGLSELLNEVSSCTVIRKMTKMISKRVSASCIRAIVVDKRYSDATVGNLLNEKKYGASKFPNEIRYGKTLKHFPAPVMAELSKNIVDWVQLHGEDIKYKK